MATCVCNHCLTKLDSRPEIVSGEMVELVKPCPRCRLRVVDKPAPKPEPVAVAAPAKPRGHYGNPHKAIIRGDHALCITCDVVIERWKRGVSKGRTPVFCDRHRGSKKVRGGAW